MLFAMESDRFAGLEQTPNTSNAARGQAGNVFFRILQQIVHHRSPEREASIALILAIAETGDYLRLEFERILGTVGMAEKEFALLVVLYLLDPVPLSPADAGYYLGWSRSALLLTVRKMEKARFVAREKDRGRSDSTGIALTRSGCREISKRLNKYLSALVAIEQRLPEAEKPVLLSLCAALRGITIPPPTPANISPPNQS